MKRFTIRNIGQYFRQAGLASITLGIVFSTVISPAGAVDEYTTDFMLQDCNFLPSGKNPFFILEPGYRLIFQGEDEGALIDLEITVLDQTRNITLNLNGGLETITTRVVEEREYEDGELVEVSKNYFALCRETNSIYYFGEDVDIYEDGEVVSHEGAWLAGQGGALPGMVMPGTFLLGARYFQEDAPEVAMDRAEHVKTGLTVETSAGTFENCVKVEETTPLDVEELSEKTYCPWVGLVDDDGIELVTIEDNRVDPGSPIDSCTATFDIATSVLHIPCFDIFTYSFWLDLGVDSWTPLLFNLSGSGMY